MKIPRILPDSGDVAHHPFEGEVSHFLDCIIEDVRPFPDLDDAASTSAVCFAADLSAQSGKPVAVNEPAGSRDGGSLGGCIALGYGKAFQAGHGLSAVVDVGGETERLGRRCNH